MGIRQYEVTLTGVSPLIMHWDNIEWADKLTEWRKKNKSKSCAGDDRYPAHTWKGYLYSDGENVAMPHDNLRTCLMKAGAMIGTGKRGATFKRRVPSGVLLDDEFYRLLVNGAELPISAIEKITSETFADHAEAAKKLGFVLFIKRAAVANSKHVRVRPLFRHWAVTGTVTVIDDTITDDVLKDIFEAAGMYVGIGDWRPGAPKSPGPYGRFEAKLRRI